MDDETIRTKRIIVSGIVQGVGFRPYVYRLAKEHRILGTVRNYGGMVEITAQSTIPDLNGFLQILKHNPNKDYEILDIIIEDITKDKVKYSDFKIIDSGSNDEMAIIPPDVCICPACEEELYTMNDRRFHNPFISCMACGPRYTIIEKLPYDRHITTMEDFSMCSSCQNEYSSPKSRRFHAQTISCNDCGPYLLFGELREDEALKEAVSLLNTGHILAVKGIGGYHYVCSPFMEETVCHLRHLKGREEKPFAVMFDSMDSVRKYCVVSDEEQALLESKARPIVLLYTTGHRMAEATGKGSIYCGAFLPYTPLQVLLTKSCGPLIMTSANSSNQPIIKDDFLMLSVQSAYLTGVLYHSRRIIRSVDDSVIKVIDKKPQIIRRSRGYVPYPVFLQDNHKNLQIFAAGSDLKAAFCLYKKGNAVVSQYFGDLEEQQILAEYKNSVKDLSDLLKIEPNIAACDLHPNYFSSKYVKQLDIPVVYVQHHHAHIASVMAEHNLNEKVIGVAFDGTGYGEDGNIWGGEFLVCEGATFKRAAHLKYTHLLGGDKSMRDARKSATCFLLEAGLSDYINDERKDIIKSALGQNINTVLTSGMGRLFDATASILGICHENLYEGECAIKLEKEAVLASKSKITPFTMMFGIRDTNDMIEIDPGPLLEELCKNNHSRNIGALALGFHYAVADLIIQVCEILRSKEKSNIVALGGGVFQNTLLTERTMNLLRGKGFRVYINHEVPPNDGAISLGQVYILLRKYSDK